MKKTISLFQRNYDGDRLVRNEVVPGAEWVIQGEGIATKKFDGTSCLWDGERLWKRHELKAGKQPPDGFKPAQEPDSVTGDTPGWMLVGDGPDDARHREGLTTSLPLEPGTYELCGPKVQGNPEKYATHVLVKHGCVVYPHAPRDFESLKTWLSVEDTEGIVWHHPDGRMVKIKKRDFGMKR